MKEIYIVSDLHMGGDGQLQMCDYMTEMVDFLRELEEQGADNDQLELIIAGDTFGFWELTSVEGNGRLDEIIAHHQPIFDQLLKTGKRVKITMIIIFVSRRFPILNYIMRKAIKING